MCIGRGGDNQEMALVAGFTGRRHESVARFRAEIEIQQDNIDRSRTLQSSQGLVRSAAFTGHLKASLRIEEVSKTLAEQTVLVD